MCTEGSTGVYQFATSFISGWYLVLYQRSGFHSNNDVFVAVWLRNMAVESRCTKTFSVVFVVLLGLGGALYPFES